VRQQNLAVQELIHEAQAMHRNGRVVAATDYFTLHVPLREPVQR
jgi:hypothetical protein